MKKSKLKFHNFGILFCILFFAAGISNLFAQSTDQSFPTAVTVNEISGRIKARDLGDARLTSYFYVFNGNQGDIFINVVTKNMDGDIDVFTFDGLKPLTKIRAYSDNPDGETGRVIYLRQPQKLILRIEGRTPNDEAATFRVKFAGSFAPAEAVAETEETKLPEVKSNDESEIRVNSVGTIIQTKPAPKSKEKVAKTVKKENDKSEDKTIETEKKKDEAVEKSEVENQKPELIEKKTEVVLTENLPSKNEDTETKTKEAITKKEANKRNSKTKKPIKPKTQAAVEESETKAEVKPSKKSNPAPVESALLENVRLVIEFKDGTKIESPMSEVLKVGVDKGILTVITKDGKIGRYSILDVAKMTIE